jgi:hypothetical protein
MRILFTLLIAMSYEGSPHPLILTDSSRNATETQDADFYDDLLKI